MQQQVSVLEFSGVIVAHIYPEHVMGVVVSPYFPWSWVAARNRVWEGWQQFTVHGIAFVMRGNTGSCDPSYYHVALRIISCSCQCYQWLLQSLSFPGRLSGLISVAQGQVPFHSHSLCLVTLFSIAPRVGDFP